MFPLCSLFCFLPCSLGPWGLHRVGRGPPAFCTPAAAGDNDSNTQGSCLPHTLLCARHWTKCFTQINSLSPQPYARGTILTQCIASLQDPEGARTRGDNASESPDPWAPDLDVFYACSWPTADCTSGAGTPFKMRFHTNTFLPHVPRSASCCDRVMCNIITNGLRDVVTIGLSSSSSSSSCVCVCVCVPIPRLSVSNDCGLKLSSNYYFCRCLFLYVVRAVASFSLLSPPPAAINLILSASRILVIVLFSHALRICICWI